MEDARKDLSPESNQPSTSDQPTSALVVPRTRAGANDPMVGAVINEKYRVVTVLATGGMGRIYTAEQIPLGRMVALKVILPTLADAMDDPETGRELIRRRFLREASVLAKLQHANIVTVFDYGRIETPASDRERFFMAMELLEGETLEQRIEHGALPEAEALGLLRQMARGLRAAHAQGTVHRDLKPSNLMLVDGPEADSIVKLLDFGVTKVMGEKSQELTDEGVVVGSPRFMSPEHMGGNVDGRTDIYSFGIIAYTMLTGSPPFKGETSMLTMMAHLNNPLPSIVKTRPELGVSEWVDAVIHRCCAKAPADRYQTAQELIDALRPPGDGASGGVRLRTSSGEIQVAQARVEPSGAGERQGDDEATAFLPAGLAKAARPRSRGRGGDRCGRVPVEPQADTRRRAGAGRASADEPHLGHFDAERRRGLRRREAARAHAVHDRRAHRVPQDAPRAEARWVRGLREGHRSGPRRGGRRGAGSRRSVRAPTAARADEPFAAQAEFAGPPRRRRFVRRRCVAGTATPARSPNGSTSSPAARQEGGPVRGPTMNGVSAGGAAAPVLGVVFLAPAMARADSDDH